MTYDTIDTAYAKAQSARARGIPAVELAISAEGRRGWRRSMRCFPEVPGVDGWVLRRVFDSDGITEGYIMRVDVVDVLAAFYDVHRKRVETPVIKARKKRIGFAR